MFYFLVSVKQNTWQLSWWQFLSIVSACFWILRLLSRIWGKLNYAFLSRIPYTTKRKSFRDLSNRLISIKSTSLRNVLLFLKARRKTVQSMSQVNAYMYVCLYKCVWVIVHTKIYPRIGKYFNFFIFHKTTKMYLYFCKWFLMPK